MNHPFVMLNLIQHPLETMVATTRARNKPKLASNNPLSYKHITMIILRCFTTLALFRLFEPVNRHHPRSFTSGKGQQK
ncbi:MAG: hypothetical protein AABZ45_10500, partial [Pseudomonadota bacterium]